ncbi:MAG: hypothetical protein ACLFVW_08790 [Phycisphaerae bacterium]
MTTTTFNTIRAVLAVCLSAICLATPAVAEDTELGQRYTDPIHGFSLRPPAETERVRQSAPGLLVSWQKRDPGTGAIAWTLGIAEAAEESEPQDLNRYSRQLQEKLKAQQRFKVDSSRIGSVADRPAIHLKGITTGGLRLWQRQVWVQVQPDRFLVFVVSGPETKKDHLDDLTDAVLKTLRVEDPSEAIQRRRKSLQRGEKLLDSITPEKLKQALGDVEPRWYLVRMQDRTVGFMWQKASAGKWEDTEGYVVHNVLLIRLPDDQTRRMWRRMFVSSDRGEEHWRQRLEFGGDEQSFTVVEQGLKHDSQLVTTLRNGEQRQSHDREIPAHVEGIYLPEAIGAMLPRFPDLSQPTTYGFARYDARSNTFEMRQFTVKDSQDVTISGKSVEAVVAADQPSMDAEATELLLDEDGNLLRMTTAEGLVMELSSDAKVTRQFPQARSMVRKMQD